MEYYDRDEVTEEEIVAEGFTLNDDFNWSGNLPKIWGEEILGKINHSNWKNKSNKMSTALGLIVKIEQDNISETLVPADTRSWEIFMQEIIQACFELSNKEAPLYISYADRNSATDLTEFSLTYSFAQKTILVRTEAREDRSINWDDGRKLLKYIFGIDYTPDDGSEDIPKKVGTYISPGDGLWYCLLSGENPNPNPNKEEQLARLLAKHLS